MNRPDPRVTPRPSPRVATQPAPTWPGTLALLLVSAVGVLAFTWPFFAGTIAVSLGADLPWLFAALLALLAVVLLAEQASGRLDAKSIAMIGVLSALGGGLRVLSAGVAGLEPMFAVVILAGRVMGRRLAFLTGASCLLTGAFLTGAIGPWVPFQMIATGWVALGAALLPRARGRVEVWLLAVYGMLGGLLYGALLNLWFWPFLGSSAPDGGGYVPGAGLFANLGHYLVFYLATSLGWDLPRGLLTAALILAAGAPLLATLRRAVRRAHFEAVATFGAPATQDPLAADGTPSPRGPVPSDAAVGANSPAVSGESP